jgi:membrane dipeptidase
MYHNHIYDDDFKKVFEEGGMFGHVDIPRLKKGKNGGAFWSAFVPCPKDGFDFSDENYAAGKSYARLISYMTEFFFFDLFILREPST